MFRMPKRPRDPNQLAKLIVDIATGEAEDLIIQHEEESRFGRRLIERRLLPSTSIPKIRALFSSGKRFMETSIMDALVGFISRAGTGTLALSHCRLLSGALVRAGVRSEHRTLPA
jgi:hypothetical protein